MNGVLALKKILPALLSALLLCLLPSCASALFYNELYSDKQYIVSINPNYVADLGDHMIVCIRNDLRRRSGSRAYALEYIALDKTARMMQITKSEWYTAQNKRLSASGDGKFSKGRLIPCEKGSFYYLLWDAVVKNSAEARAYGSAGSFAKLYDFGDSTISINRATIDDRGSYKVAWFKWTDNKNGGWYLDFMAMSKSSAKELVLKRVRFAGDGRAVSFEERPFDKRNFTTCVPRTTGELLWKAVMGK